MKLIEEIKNSILNKDISEALLYIAQLPNQNPVFSTSFGAEDQVMTHFIFSKKLPIKVFTLDTGRLFAETYQTHQETIDRYNQKINVYCPNTNSTELLTTQKGMFSFRNSIEDRKECCYIRKVEPLKRALKGHTIWLTGIRASHSNTREQMPMVEWDETNQIIKIHLLLHWSLNDVNEFIKKNEIPYNVLHDKGFVSIGCQPCTRAIVEGEDFRAGRWWWEDAEKKECGLHK